MDEEFLKKNLGHLHITFGKMSSDEVIQLMKYINESDIDKYKDEILVILANYYKLSLIKEEIEASKNAP